MKVEIRDLAGASGIIVASCPSRNAAIILAKVVKCSPYVHGGIRVIDKDGTIVIEYKRT